MSYITTEQAEAIEVIRLLKLDTKDMTLAQLKEFHYLINKLCRVDILQAWKEFEHYQYNESEKKND